jgi:hypothetical protein
MQQHTGLIEQTKAQQRQAAASAGPQSFVEASRRFISKITRRHGAAVANPVFDSSKG